MKLEMMTLTFADGSRVAVRVDQQHDDVVEIVDLNQRSLWAIANGLEPSPPKLRIRVDLTVLSYMRGDKK